MTTENTNPKVSLQTVAVPTEAPAIDGGLVARSIVYLAVLANAVAPHFGINLHLNTNQSEIYNYVSDGLLVLSFAHAYWKNNNISKAARIINQVASQINLFGSQVEKPNTSDMGKPDPATTPAQPAPVAEQPAQPAPVAEAPAQPAAQAPVVDNTNTSK